MDLPQKIAEQFAAIFGKNRFRVKLHAPYQAAYVTERHHGSILGPGDFPQFRGEWIIHRERMIAHHIESVREAVEQRIHAIVFHLRHLAVRRFYPADCPTEFERNALMAQTDAQNRNFRAADHIGGNSEITRDRGMARAWRNHDGVEAPRLDRRPVRFIVANDRRQFTRQGSGGVSKIPGEGVVVIDNQEPQHDFVEAVSLALPGPR